MAVKEKSGLIRGLNKGHVSFSSLLSYTIFLGNWVNGGEGVGGQLLMCMLVQKVTPREFKPRISRTKGHLSKRTQFVREIVKEVSGYVWTFL